MGIQCRCGRFLANAHAVSGQGGEGYSWHEFVADVRGDCARCGLDVQAGREGDMCWWWAWDAWNWPPDAPPHRDTIESIGGVSAYV